MGHTKPLIIYGIGQLTLSFIKKNEHEKQFDIAALTADKEFIRSDTFLGQPLIPFDEIDIHYPPDAYDMLILIGYKNMRNRKIMFGNAKSVGYNMPNYIGSGAIHYNDITIGSNNLIYSSAYIGPNGNMKDNNIIRPMTYIGHNFEIGSHNYISPGCNIGGNCSIGDGSFIGIGSTVIDGIAIANETLLAAGSILLDDTEPYTMYAGNPAKKIREHRQSGMIIRD